MTENEVNYINAMHQAKCMLSQGKISYDDFLKIEDKIAKKYSLDKTNLYRSNHLIKTAF